MIRERRVRMTQIISALRVQGGDGAFRLVDRYGEKQVIGTYRTVETLERGSARYGERELKRSQR
jgi:hypothetical protein